MNKDKNKHQLLRDDFKGVLKQTSNSSGIICMKYEKNWQCSNLLSTVFLISIFYFFSISLTFYNQKFIHQFRFPLTITMTHLITKFCISSLVRFILYKKSGKERVILSWMDYCKKVAPPGIASSLDIGLSNWSFEYITISLYTMTKTTCIVFILLFSIIFKLEKLRPSLIAIILCIAVGLFMFTYESTQFHLFGFTLVLAASFISGLRWTLNQMLLQRKENGLCHPVDMMFHIQPWMVLSLLPLSSGFEVMRLAVSEQAFAYEHNYQWISSVSILSCGAILAFCLELSEFLVLSKSSSLTLSVAGIFKEVIVLLLAAFINGDRMSVFNGVGLVSCLVGIALHILFKNRLTQEAQH